MKDKTIFDTTTLVYAFNQSEPKKRRTCKKFVEDVFLGNKRGVLTNQILSELFVVLTKKIENPLNKEKAGEIIKGFVKSPNWEKINYTSESVFRATKISKNYNLSFWDSLIVSTMLEKDIFKIVTEDSDFKKVPKIKIENPFKNL